VRDNGGGLVIGSEIEPSKHEQAVAHLAQAGLAEVSEVRLGDALETLRVLPEPIDLVLLDGWKDLYLPVLELLTPKLRPGSVVFADNIFTFRRSLRPYVEYMQSGRQRIVRRSGLRALLPTRKPHVSREHSVGSAHTMPLRGDNPCLTSKTASTNLVRMRIRAQRGAPPCGCMLLLSFAVATPALAETPRFIDPQLGAGFVYVHALRDADGDGDLDAFSAGNVGLENVGTPFAPRFAPPASGLSLASGSPRFVIITGGAYSPPLADLDGDGNQDRVVVDETGAVSFQRNLGNDALPRYGKRLRPVPGLRLPYSFGDVDGDGDLDAFGQDGSYGVFFENVGDSRRPVFSERRQNPFDLCCDHFALGDLDGDGDLDALVAGIGGAGYVSFRENPGRQRDARFSRRKPDRFGLRFASRPTLALGDLDLDGDLDLLAGAGDGTLALAENLGSARHASFAPAPAPGRFGLADVGEESAPAIGDLDADGDLDIVAGNREGAVLLFENLSPPGGFGFAPRGEVIPGLAAVGEAGPALGDLDRDGDLDLLVGDQSGDTTYFENVGTAEAPVFAAGVVNPFGLENSGYAAFGLPRATPHVADMDHDGDLDVFSRRRFFENVGREARCPAEPDPGCIGGFERASLTIREDRAGREKHQLDLRGAFLETTALGDPMSPGGSRYALCLYDDDRRLALERVVDHAGGTCDGVPCWRRLPSGVGFRLRNRAATWDGASSILLTSTRKGSRIRWVSRNRSQIRAPAFHSRVAPALFRSAEATAQLRVSDGACFSATWTGATRREGRVLIAE
jgi:hypothetical protein